MSQVDIGTLSEVPEQERLEVDGHIDDYAIDGGNDTENLLDIYENPGGVVEVIEE